MADGERRGERDAVMNMFLTTGFLSKDVKTPKSSLGAYLRATFSEIQGVRSGYNAGSKPMVVSPSSAPTTVIGSAVDLDLRLRVAMEATVASVVDIRPWDESFTTTIFELFRCALGGYESPGLKDLESRAVYALGLVAVAFRAPSVVRARLTEMLRDGTFTLPVLMEEASDEAAAELTALRELGARELIAHISPPFRSGPTFDLSHYETERTIAAEADLIADGILIDVKTTVGKQGVDALDTSNIYQLLGYALLDYSNEYSINNVGIYSARFGRFAQWPLGELMERMAARPVDLSAEREQVWRMMHLERRFL